MVNQQFSTSFFLVHPFKYVSLGKLGNNLEDFVAKYKYIALLKDIYKNIIFLCVGMIEVKSRNPLGTYVFYGFDRYVLKILETY